MKKISKKQKGMWITTHAKSSAVVVSISVHLLLIVLAGTFVAVTVITKDNQKFEAKPVSRPKMVLKKLQVPISIKKKRMQKPRLRKRIVVQPKMNSTMPDIKMPVLAGVKGGLGGGAAGGIGGAGGVGFSMPGIEVFGLRSKGEKVFLALDSDAFIMRDEVGGMLAYAIIKNELAKIINGLNPTTLFNLSVFDHHHATMLFPQMVPATRGNVAQVEEWLDSLNKVSTGMEAGAYGVQTLGKGGTQLPMSGDLARGKLRKDGLQGRAFWYRPAAEAMLLQADAIFILSGWWGVMRHAKGDSPEWSDASRTRWEEHLLKAQELHKEENKKRASRGEPPQVIRDAHMFIRTYFPDNYDSWRPPEPEWYEYSGKDYAEALHILSKENSPKPLAKSGLSKKKKGSFSLNVIFFARADDPDAQAWEVERFDRLTNLCKGDCRVIYGLEAIKSSVLGSGN